MTARTRRLLSPTLPELWAFLAIALPVVAALAAPMSAVDLAYGVRAGQLMLASGQVLRTDPFTFTVGGQPWLDQQWLAQVFFALIHGIGGWALVALVRATLVGVLYGLVFASCRIVGASLRTSAALTLAAFLIGAPSLAMRPQLLGEVFFAVTLALVLARERHPRRLLVVPLLVVVWANVHGTFFLGVALIAVAVLADLSARSRRRSEIVVLALSVLATGLTPWVFGIWPYALSLGTSPVVRSLAAEWQVTSPLAFPGVVFYPSVVAVFALAALAARGRPVPLAQLWAWAALTVALAVLGVYAERGIAWWTIAAPPVAAALLVPGFTRAAVSPSRGSHANAAIAFVVTLFGLALLPFWRPLTDDSGGALPLLSDAPARLSASVRAITTAGDRVFVPQPWASWFEYDVPGVLVPIDSRFELYSTQDLDRYLAVQAGTDSAVAALRDWDVSLVAGSPRLMALSDRLAASVQWSRLPDREGSWTYRRR